MVAMAIGSVFIAFGFGMFGFIEGILLFALAMVILTIGEMIVAPFAQSMAAKFSPEDMRGRYMATFSLFNRIFNIFMPYLVGVIMDTLNPDWVWYGCGIVGSIAVLSYLALQGMTKERFKEVPVPEEIAVTESAA
jgi:MFS family permease